MKTDTYSKVVLTIIAACLMAIVMRDLDVVPQAFAAETERLPQMAGAGVYQVQVVGIGKVPGLGFEPLPVVMTENK